MNNGRNVAFRGESRELMMDKYKRVNNDTWICNQLEELVIKYESYLKLDEEKESLGDYEQGEHNELLAIVQELKELLYKK